MGIFRKIALAPSVGIGNAATNIFSKTLSVAVGRKVDIKNTGLTEASNSKFGKVLGTSILVVGGLTAGAAIAPPSAVSYVTTGATNIIKKIGQSELASVESNAFKYVVTRGATGIFVSSGGLKLVAPATKLFSNVVSGTAQVVTDPKNATPTDFANTGIAILAGLGLAGGFGSVTNYITNARNRQAINENTRAILDDDRAIGGSSSDAGSSETMQDSGVQTQETQNLTEEQIVPVKNTSPQTQGQKINQSVKLYVNSQNKKTYKRYLNIISH